jgi:DNA polymerase-3 subunit gamma/tau
VKVGQEQAHSLVELPDSELRFLTELGRTCSEEDIHMLFDMALKGVGDISKASDPRVVLEMVLLRMAGAPKLIEIQKFFANVAAGIPAGLSTGITSPEKATLTKMAMTSKPLPTKQAPPKPASALSLNPQDRWFDLVQNIKSSDSLLGAKIENLMYISEKNKVIELAIPAKMTFLRGQVSDSATKEKLQSFIDHTWGPGYAFEIKLSQEAAVGTSAKALEQQKEQKKQQTLTEQVAAHPKVIAATAAFGSQIKSIKGTT